MSDSRLRFGSYAANPTSSSPISAFTNNVIERADLQFYHSYGSENSQHTVTLFNNLFINGSMALSYDTGTNAYKPTWKAQDNLFDGTSQSGYGSGYATYVTVGNNGFTSGTSNGLGGSSNKTGLTADYQVGRLGSYYYPTSGSGLYTLVNAGSRTSTNAALCQFTVLTTDGSKDSGVIDIGFHYVATDSNGLAIDTDGDGIPDCLEDVNGNGLSESTETDWQTSNSGVSGAAGLVVFTPLK
jgi:hypothetical protein